MAKALNLLRLEQIRIDGGTQSRVTMNQATIAAYADAMTEGDTFPQLLVYFDGADFWLADGFHRFHACKAIGAVDVDCEVIAGSLDDAILRSLGVNALHGLPPTNADKRKSVTTCLTNPQWAKWSDKTISEKCGVSRGFVQTVRSSLASDASDATERRTYINKHGTESVMKTGGIGGAIQQRAEQGAPPQEDQPTEDPEPTPAARTTPAAATTPPEAPPDEHDDAMATQAELLEQFRAEADELQAQLTAATANDKAAEIVKWRKAYDHANRQYSEAQDRAKEAADREAWTMRQLRRCGKAIGQDDPKNIAPAVEALCRKVKVTA